MQLELNLPLNDDLLRQVPPGIPLNRDGAPLGGGTLALQQKLGALLGHLLPGQPGPEQVLDLQGHQVLVLHPEDVALPLGP